jgi:hypothetical protein
MGGSGWGVDLVKVHYMHVYKYYNETSYKKSKQEKAWGKTKIHFLETLRWQKECAYSDVLRMRTE